MVAGGGETGKCVENVEKVSPLPQVEMFGIYQRRLQFFASFSHFNVALFLE